MTEEVPSSPHEYHVAIRPRSATPDVEPRFERTYGTTPEKALERLVRQGRFDPLTETADINDEDDGFVVEA